MSSLTHPSRPAPNPDTIRRLREFTISLRRELVFLLGADCRDDIERMTIEQLMRLKGRTLEQLMAAPGPTAA